jgi:predicted nucleic acid-binding protein
MILVLDVSAAIEIILQKDKKDKFNAVYEEASWVIAPDLFISEITNVFWKYHKARALTREECIQFSEDGINMVDDFIAAGDLWKEALGEGIKNSHSVYDMLYAVLTRRNDATLATNDLSLAQICKKMNISSVH